MRCLHCGKKLSLLKLAKGDSFCSPEHFDAHQLKLSKDAFERLMSVPDIEAPKGPPLPHADDPAAPREATNPVASPVASPATAPITSPATSQETDAPEPAAPLPSRSVLSPAAAPASVLPEQAIARIKALDAPPAAPFAPQFFASLPPVPAKVLGEIAPGADEAPRPEPAMPALDVEATSCILNLYWRLNHLPSAPADWAAGRGHEIEPQHFAGGASMPRSALAPDFPQYEEDKHEQEPVSDLAPLVEAGPFVDAVRPATSEPMVALFGPVGPAGRGELSLPAGPQPIDPLPAADFRLPFLIAPSFRERRSKDPGLDGAASPTPRDQDLAVTFGPVQGPADAQARGISRAVTLSAIAPPKASDARGAPLAGAMAFLASRTSLPGSKTHEALPGWHAGSDTVLWATAPLEFSPAPLAPCESLKAAPNSLLSRSGFTLSPEEVSPARALVGRPPLGRPIAPRPGIRRSAHPAPKPETSRLKPVQIAAQSSPKPSVRKRVSPIPVPAPSPQGQAPRTMDFPVRAVAGTCSPQLSTLIDWEILSPTGWSPTSWNGRAAHLPLPAYIARPAALPRFPLQAVCQAPERRTGTAAVLESRAMTRVSFAQNSLAAKDTLAPEKRPKPTAVAVAPRFAAAPPVSKQHRLGEGGIASVGGPRPFAPAPAGVVAWPTVLPRQAAILPVAPLAVAHAASIGLCAAALAWEMKQLFWPASAQLKFLPVRKGPVMPPAPVWPRLGVPPR